MSADTFRPGGSVPIEAVMLLEYEYRVSFQPQTEYGKPAGFRFEHQLGPVTLGIAKATLADHVANVANDRMLIVLERSPINGNTWVLVEA